MKVSILVPLYKVEDYIVQCARSLFEQNYEDCEFIFVDDCSPDETVARLKRILDDEYSHLYPRTHIIRHSRNRGVAEARNTALDCATGKFILFVDSDDWCNASLVSSLVRVQKSSDADIVSSDYMRECSHRRRHIHTHWVGGREGSIKVVLAQSFALPNRVWSMLIRTDMIHRNGVRFESGINYGEDSLFLVQLLYFAREIGHVNRALYHYRADSDGSYSNNVSRSSIRNYVRSQLLIYDFLASRDATIRYTTSLMLSRMNLRRWLSKRRGKSSISTLGYRLFCWVVNQIWTIRCAIYGL